MCETAAALLDLGGTLIGEAFLDRIAERAQLTKTLEILVEDSRTVVRGLTAVLWFGILQVTASAIVLAYFDEPAVSWALVGGAIMFTVSWAWLAVTGDLFVAILIAVFAGGVNIYVHVALGGYGYSGGAIFYGITLVAAVALMLGRRAAVISGVVYGVAGIAFGFLEQSLRDGRPPPDPTLTTLIFVSVLVSSVAAIPALLAYLLGTVRAERRRSESLLLNMLPAEVASELKRQGQTRPKRFDSISVLFADIVGFTPISAAMAPDEVVEILNTVFSHFDRLVDKYAVEKIRTIGDSYMVAAGVPVPRDDHAHVLAAMALEMLDYAEQTNFAFRIGINSGPVVAGIIGLHKFQYDVWGDTVNTAYRMESHGETGRIQISDATNDLIQGDFRTTARGPIEVKGKGTLETWFLEGVKTPAVS